MAVLAGWGLIISDQSSLITFRAPSWLSTGLGSRVFWVQHI